MCRRNWFIRCESEVFVSYITARCFQNIPDSVAIDADIRFAVSVIISDYDRIISGLPKEFFTKRVIRTVQDKKLGLFSCCRLLDRNIGSAVAVKICRCCYVRTNSPISRRQTVG